MIETFVGIIVNCWIFASCVSSEECFRFLIGPVDLFISLNNFIQIFLPAIWVHHLSVNKRELVSFIAVFKSLVKIWRISEHRGLSYDFIIMRSHVDNILPGCIANWAILISICLFEISGQKLIHVARVIMFTSLTLSFEKGRHLLSNPLNFRTIALGNNKLSFFLVGSENVMLLNSGKRFFQ